MSIIDRNIISIAEELLGTIREGKPNIELVGRLAGYPPDLMKRELDDDFKRKAFWVNVYNIQFQLLAVKVLPKAGLFSRKLFTVAKSDFSLDLVEHGILRRKKWKYGLGYLPWAVKGIDREILPETFDPRIHFVLNCGAKSCPPITILQPGLVEKQLTEAQRNFLLNETVFGKGKKELVVSRICLWFLGDFGGKSGIRKLLEKELKKDLRGYRISFGKFNWDQDLNKFSNAGKLAVNAELQ